MIQKIFFLIIVIVILSCQSENDQVRSVSNTTSNQSRVNENLYETMIDSFPAGEAEKIAFSNDGSKFLFLQNGFIYIMSINGNLLNKLQVNDSQRQLISASFEKNDSEIIIFNHFIDIDCKWNCEHVNRMSVDLKGNVLRDKNIFLDIYKEYIIDANTIENVKDQNKLYDYEGNYLAHESYPKDHKSIYITEKKFLIRSVYSQITLYNLQNRKDNLEYIQDDEKIIFQSLRGDHTKNITSIDYSANLNLVASGSLDKTIKLWDLEGNLIKTFSESKTAIVNVKFYENYLVSVNKENEIHIWDIESNKIVNRYKIDSINPDKIEVSSLGIIGIPLKTGGIATIDLKNNKSSVLGNDNKVKTSLFSYLPIKKLIIYSTKEKTYIYDLKKNKYLEHTLPPDLYYIQISKQEDFIVLAPFLDSNFYIYNTSDGGSKRIPFQDRINNLILHSNDQILTIQGITFSSMNYGKNGFVYTYSMKNNKFNTLTFKANTLSHSEDNDLYIGTIGPMNCSNLLCYKMKIIGKDNKVFHSEVESFEHVISPKGSIFALSKIDDNNNTYFDLMKMDNLKSIKKYPSSTKLLSIRDDDNAILYQYEGNLFFQDLRSDKRILVTQDSTITNIQFLGLKYVSSTNPANEVEVTPLEKDSQMNFHFFKDGFIAINSENEYFYSNPNLKSKISVLDKNKLELVDIEKSKWNFSDNLLLDFFEVSNE